MRALLALPPLAPLDPFALARRMGAHIATPADLPGLSPADRAHLLTTDPTAWSAGTIPLPGNRIAILINSSHAATRQRASLMEELAHHYLGHQPSQVITVGPLTFRTCNHSQETQASWVAAAALIPRPHLWHALQTGLQRTDLAERCGVSIQLVIMRENMTGIRLAN
ncbi:MAG: ImmA/IrrE family metallo-endopeptidase [Chloroflexi bacterium]|nr:ImmA/IrrE family metallo-endopeptidase [Chloroflexota bacterium]